MTRRETPDIFSELMGNVAIKQEENIKINQENNKTIKQESKNTTFALPVSLLDKLEDNWMMLRRETKDKRITKSLIVEKAIEVALKELETKGLESDFAKQLIE